ncbi:hypothetical protein D8B26_007520 [Coccidioides posadasii str. Silveira]|uniref:Uncharacterized protein n=1 Tax=Coccidioides posadasii (strain RMSCC 757 / Silveira) TaxID=443226 RepID=E9D255_COCPS|nr:conserved hypothetical protein [Coccidioides posadasii str. Silveira]QVM12904.1 hypothetical protein D8B26_007520 [Coccidioides posadasii str. Silveira]
MSQSEDEKPSLEDSGPLSSPHFNLASSIIAHCLANNPFEAAFINRGPGIFAAAFASFSRLPAAFVGNKANPNAPFRTNMEAVVAANDDAHSYSSFASTAMSSDVMSSSGMSTPSTMIGDASVDSSFFSIPPRCSSPYTPPYDLGSSSRDPEQALSNVDDSDEDQYSDEDSDCEFADVESDHGSEVGSAGYDEYSVDEMAYEGSEDGDSCIGGDEMENDDDSIEEQLSFISFERSVHFSSADDEVIPDTGFEEPVPDAVPEMTCHERMALAEHLKTRRIGNWENGGDYDPEEHSRDSLQLDKELLSAYINGLRTLNRNRCETALRSRTLHASHERLGQVDVQTDKDMNEYFERINDLLRGIFPNLFTEDEYLRILSEAESAISIDECGQLTYESHSVAVQHMIRSLLAERLGYDDMFLEDEILEWFAGNLIAPLGQQALARRHQEN